MSVGLGWWRALQRKIIVDKEVHVADVGDYVDYWVSFLLFFLRY